MTQRRGRKVEKTNELDECRGKCIIYLKQRSESVCALVCVNASLPKRQSFRAVLIELLIIEEHGLIEKINIPERCNEFHVEEEARYQLPVRHTHAHIHTPEFFISTD